MNNIENKIKMNDLDPVTQPLFLYSRFQDYDEFIDTVHAWELDFIQLEPGEFHVELMQIGIDTSLISRACFNRLVHQRGNPPQDFRTFAVLSDPSFRLVWRCREITGDVVMAFPPGEDLDAISQAGFDVFTLSFSEDILEEIGRRLGIPSTLDFLGKTEVFTCHPYRMRELRKMLHDFCCAMIKAPPQKRDHRLFGQLKDKIPLKLLSTLSATLLFSDTDKISSRVKDRALNTALACIEESADLPLSVKELCRISGASERTLQYAFLERFSVSPKAYLQSVRFNKVRRELRNGDPHSTRVTDIANDWGFWHMGQFAADYRRYFGELPSKTLGR